MLLTPLSEFDVLNLALLTGWLVLAAELCRILSSDPALSQSPFAYPLSPWLEHLASPFVASAGLLWRLTMVLELGCWIDVLRMLTGSLRGNLALGLSLHSIRTFCLLYVLPTGPEGDRCHSVSHVVLLAWAFTEVCRYPCYLLTSPFARLVRDLCPVITFPVGVGMEAAGCAMFVHRAGGVSSATAAVAALVVLINTLGGLSAYPGIVTRAIKGLKGEKPKAK